MDGHLHRRSLHFYSEFLFLKLCNSKTNKTSVCDHVTDALDHPVGTNFESVFQTRWGVG